MEHLFVYGAGGHAKVVISIVEAQGRYAIDFIVADDNLLHGRDFFGYRVVGGQDELTDWTRLGGVSRGLVGIGNNADRIRVSRRLEEQGLELVTAVHPSAVMARGSSIGPGTVVMPGVVVNPDTIIGRWVVVNTSAGIDHDCVIEDGVHVGPGCRLCGGVWVGEGTLIGVGAVVVPGIRIGRNVLIGAGSVVIEDLPDDTVAVGNPCRQTARGRTVTEPRE